jgi:protein-S-isoprenylcysteine O-methyltransferase Ste14
VPRLFWICFGAAAHLLFVATLPLLFLLLYRGGGDLLGIEPPAWGVAGPGLPGGLLLDLVLLGQFGMLHSLFLLPGVRRQLERWAPSELYGSLFTTVSCLALLATALLWQPLPGEVYSTRGLPAWLLLGAFLGSWCLLIYSMSLTGLGFQTGFTPWLCYTRRQPAPPRRFVTTGLYRILRHPIYLSFLGLIWFTPRLTTDRLLLACVWTGYVYLGSTLKDSRLLLYLGEPYREYMARVPGYPFVPWGPLARQNRPGPTPQSSLRARG